MFRLPSIAFFVSLAIGVNPATAQVPATPPRPARPTPPTRDPNTPGYVAAKDLPDGANAPATADGNFILGPTHSPAPEMTVQEDVPHGTVSTFTMESAESKIYPGIAREPNTFGKVDPAEPSRLLVTTSHPAPYTRRVAVYVPKQYVPGTAAPFIVGADGPDKLLFTALDNLIAHRRVPVMVAISIGNGSGRARDPGEVGKRGRRAGRAVRCSCACRAAGLRGAPPGDCRVRAGERIRSPVVFRHRRARQAGPGHGRARGARH